MMAASREAGGIARAERGLRRWSAILDAASATTDPAPPLRSLLAQLGFEGLTSMSLAPLSLRGERVTAFWSTASPRWASRYQAYGYASFDPRVRETASRLTPIVWDAADASDEWRVQRFLDDAARENVRSGVAVSIRAGPYGRTVVAFDSARSPLSEADCAHVIARLGELMLLAVVLHERVLGPRLQVVPPAARSAGPPLTTREHACLAMAANGLTSADIGSKLGIAERTVNFHFGNVLRKLDAMNRSEAIAKAVAGGVVDAAALAGRGA